MKIAVISQDAVVADFISYAAERRGHQTVRLDTFEKLFGRLPFEPAVIVASVATIDDSSLQKIRRARETYPAAALFVTMERPTDPASTALVKAGAQEIIREPYNPGEVVLRAESWVTAHSRPAGLADALLVGDIEIALERYFAAKAGNTLTLTKLELRLLYCLCEHSPHLAPMERLLRFSWDGGEDPDSSLLKTHISHIRRKLHEAGGQPVQITSRQTLGYVLSM